MPTHPSTASPDPRFRSPARPAAAASDRPRPSPALSGMRALRGEYHDGQAVVVTFDRLPLLAARPELRAVARRELGIIARRLGLAVLDGPAGSAVLLCRPASLDGLETALGRLNAVFGGPAVDAAAGEAAAGDAGMAVRRYDLGRDADAAALDRHLAEGEAAAAAAGARPPATPLVRPLELGDLARIADVLAHVPIEPLIRRQHAIELVPAGSPRPVLCEAYVSIAALAAAVAPGVDLCARPSLFQSLTRILDQRLLRALADAPPSAGALSLNLNIASLATAAFADLDRAWTGARRPMLEFQLGEVLACAAGFAPMRDDLRRRGYGVAIDGVRADALAMLALDRLEPDLLKLRWRGDGGTGTAATPAETLRRRIRTLGAGRIMLAHTETEDALRWGLGLGITRFQGFFIDRVVRAIDPEPGA